MFGTSIHDPPPGILPGSVVERVLPVPRRLAPGTGVVPLRRAGLPCARLVTGPADDPAAVIAADWLRDELRALHGWAPAATGADARVRILVGTPREPAVRALVEELGVELPGAAESFVLRVGDGHVLLASRDGLGLLRGVTTLAQLVTAEGSENLVLPACEIEDAPALPLRLLIGWVRSDPDPRSVVDLAFRWKYNRVYYGTWSGGTAAPHTAADRALVRYARARGVELMFQLSRLSFPQGFDASSPADTERVLAAYAEAVEAGFRSFGILFDDQAFQPVDDEIRLTRAIHGRLGELLGEAPELTFVPQVYWVPGELAGWPPQPERAEEFKEKHRAYLQALGEGLPPGVLVYIANNWNDFPPGYASLQETQFNAPVRRRPIFFENQLTNDYRRAIILPFPVHNRPPEMARVMGGYGLNLPMPYAAYRASIACCGALAWNPQTYHPPAAWGAAVLSEFGPGRAPIVLEALNLLNALFVEWTSPHFPAASHYGSLNAKLRDGQVSTELLDGWQARLRDLTGLFVNALGVDGCGTDALGLYVEEAERLRLDFGMVRDILVTRGRLPGAGPERRAELLAALAARQSARRRAVLDIQARRAPPSPGLHALLVQRDGSDLVSGTPASDVPDGWWLSYFWIPLRDEIDALLRRGDELLAQAAP